jgi:uncharacterized protein YjbI with pentapeptide repeats
MMIILGRYTDEPVKEVEKSTDLFKASDAKTPVVVRDIVVPSDTCLVAGTNLKGMTFENCDAAGFWTTNTNFADAQITDVNMPNCLLGGVFDGARLQVGAHAGLIISDSAADAVVSGSFRGATIAGNWAGANFEACDFTGADLSDVTSWDGCSFDSMCKLNRALMGDASLAQALLNFNSHTLTGTMLYQEALKEMNTEYQAYALLIREREDLCQELWTSDSKLYPVAFMAWAFTKIDAQYKTHGGYISESFRKAIDGLLQ